MTRRYSDQALRGGIDRGEGRITVEIHMPDIDIFGIASCILIVSVENFFVQSHTRTQLLLLKLSTRRDWADGFNTVEKEWSKDTTSSHLRRLQTSTTQDLSGNSRSTTGFNPGCIFEGFKPKDLH